MISRWLDDPWRVIQIYALMIALLVGAVGVIGSTGSDRWNEDGRPVVHVELLTR